jgi:hypothetical protein
MEIAILIFSCIALCASAFSVFFTMQERNERKRQCKAVLDYVDRIVEDINPKLEDLTKGVVPEYEAAKAAADATNEFHRGIANILNYNEIDALRRVREAEANGGEAEE